jgi:hypothetical protein
MSVASTDSSLEFRQQQQRASQFLNVRVLVYVSDEAVSLLVSAWRKRANNDETELGEETENLPTYCIALLTLNPGLRRLVARRFGIFS